MHIPFVYVGQGVMKVVMEFDQVFWPPETEFLNCTPLYHRHHPESKSRKDGDNANRDNISSPPSPLTTLPVLPYNDNTRGLLYSFWNVHKVAQKQKLTVASKNTAVTTTATTAVLVGFVLGDEACRIVAGLSEIELRALIVRRCRLISCTHKTDHSSTNASMDSVVAASSEAHNTSGTVSEAVGYQHEESMYDPRHITVTNWNEDKFSRGCYSYVPKGMSSNTGKKGNVVICVMCMG